MLPIRIKGTGIYAPGEPIGNEELKKLAGIDFDAEKIEMKVGISKRHIAHLRGMAETTADFATKAALNAIADAQIDTDDIGLVIVATDTPEFISPATAIVVQGRLQGSEKWSAAFDVNASCASFTIAFDAAAGMLASNHGAYLFLGNFYDSKESSHGSSINGNSDTRPVDPWTAFIVFKWLMF